MSFTLILLIFIVLLFVFPPVVKILTSPNISQNEKRIKRMITVISIIVSLTSFVSCSLSMSKGNKKFSYPHLFSNFLYMTLWLFFSIAYERLGQESISERWFISFVPAAYFFGGFLENIKSDSLKNTLFTILILGILLFKLFYHGIIS